MLTSAGLEEQIEKLRGQLAQERGKEARLSDALTEAYRTGSGDPSEIAGERGLTIGRREGLENAIKDLEGQAERLRGKELASRALDEMLSCKKRIGGLAGEHGRNIERARTLLDQLKSTLEKVMQASVRQEWEETAIRVLSERFALPIPDLLMLPPAKIDEDISRLKEAIRSVIPESGRGPSFGPGRSLSFRARETTVALSRYGVESPVQEIVEVAGPTEAEIQAGLVREERAQKEASEERLHLGSVEADLARARAGSRTGI